MKEQTLIVIFNDYNFNDDEINVALKLLNIINLKNTTFYDIKNAEHIFNYERNGYYTITVDIWLNSKTASVKIHNIEKGEIFTLVEDDLENFVDTINYDIDDITNILNSFSNLNDDRY